MGTIYQNNFSSEDPELTAIGVLEFGFLLVQP